MYELYFITDRKLSPLSEEEQVQQAILGGADAIQYREKELGDHHMLEVATKLKKICRNAGVPFIINDSLQVALMCRADGIHLGQSDIPYGEARAVLGEDKIIGLSASTLKQAIGADKLGADYIGLGPIFATATKKDAAPAGGLELIRKVKKHTPISLIAIGGINEKNIEPVILAGADGVCAISAILKSGSVKKTVSGLKQKIKDAKNSRRHEG